MSDDGQELEASNEKRIAARPSFETIFMNLAYELSSRSTCKRLSVGCVIVTPDYRKVLAVGYNGNATGLHNGCDSEEPGKCGCLHAEENAVINCDVPRDTKKIVLCTHLPCGMCAKRIIQLGGVVEVMFHRDYRLRDGAGFLSTSGIHLRAFPHYIPCFQTP